MRKPLLLALVVLVTTLLTTRPAHAHCGQHGSRCPVIVDVMAATLGLGLLGAYTGATGYFAYHDLTDDRQALNYSGYEVGVNGAFSALFTSLVIDRIGAHDARGALVPAAFSAVHTTLAIHGIANVYRHRAELGPLDPPGHGELAWGLGIAYGFNTLCWTAGAAGTHHGTRYGLAEVGFNAPFVAGFGYLALRDLSADGAGPKPLLYGGLAAISGALVYHGVKTALHPYESPGLDFLGTDVTPAVVSDGIEQAPGVAMAGTW